jgi:PIN domain nuclease of toxin-antitoxin system
VILLDTHVLVWLEADDRRLGRKSRTLIEQAWQEEGVAIPAIAFWEVGLLQQRGRVSLPVPIPVWRSSLLRDGFVELPLDGDLAVRSLDLDGLPDDPADRFVVATAIANGATLMTADARLLEWRHPVRRHDATT